MHPEEAFLREYEKTIDLFMSEGRIAWELVSVWVVVQVGLGSAYALLHAQGVGWGSVGYTVLFSAGVVSNLAWIPMQYRAKMWRENWLLYGLRLERELRQRGLMLNVFGFELHVRDKKRALDLFDREVRDRNQKLWERIGALRVAHYSMFIMVAFWLIPLLFSLFAGFPK